MWFSDCSKYVFFFSAHLSSFFEDKQAPFYSPMEIVWGQLVEEKALIC